MANKDKVLHQIQELAKRYEISKAEILDAFDATRDSKGELALTKKLGVAAILLSIGGGVVALGIFILIWQNWNEFSPETRILITLGPGLLSLLVALLSGKDKKIETVSSAFFLIFCLVTPIGLWVTCDQLGFDMGGYGTQTFISCIMWGSSLVLFLTLRKNIFILFSILFGTWLYFSLTGWMLEGTIFADGWRLSVYRVLIAGVSYMLLGYAFSNDRDFLSGFLYGFGALGFLGATLSLGGWEPHQSIFWELMYPVCVFTILLLSIYVKSKSFLTWGTLFLMGYIFKITAEYFSDSLGWPIVLVLSGLAMIGVGYLSLTIKNRYLAR